MCTIDKPTLWEFPCYGKFPLFWATRPIKGWSDVSRLFFPLGAAQQVKGGDLCVCVDVLVITVRSSSGSLERDFPSQLWSGTVAWNQFLGCFNHTVLYLKNKKKDREKEWEKYIFAWWTFSPLKVFTESCDASWPNYFHKREDCGVCVVFYVCVVFCMYVVCVWCMCVLCLCGVRVVLVCVLCVVRVCVWCVLFVCCMCLCACVCTFSPQVPHTLPQ